MSCRAFRSQLALSEGPLKNQSENHNPAKPKKKHTRILPSINPRVFFQPHEGWREFLHRAERRRPCSVQTPGKLILSAMVFIREESRLFDFGADAQARECSVSPSQIKRSETNHHHHKRGCPSRCVSWLARRLTFRSFVVLTPLRQCDDLCPLPVHAAALQRRPNLGVMPRGAPPSRHSGRS